MEEEYGLYYPGEVLERMKEHRSMTKPVYRALGLALAKSDYLQEKCMFNGTQKSRFWKQFGKVLGKKDLCCIAVGCLLSEKDRKSWFDELYAYPYEKVEEMVFILSVFPEDITLWQLLKGKVAACLGSRRTVSVYEDWPVYAWVTGKYDKRLKNDRTKDVAVLKRLMKLSRIKRRKCEWYIDRAVGKIQLYQRRSDFSKWCPYKVRKRAGSAGSRVSYSREDCVNV